MNRALQVFSFLLIVCTASAVELVAPPIITQSAASATISWRTDVACGTRASYGMEKGQLTQKLEGAVGAEHSVTLSGLEKGKTYYWEIGSARQKLAEGQFTLGQAAASTSPVPPGKVSAPANSSNAPPAAKKSILTQLAEALKGPTASPAKSANTGVQAKTAPPTRVTWGRIDSLQDHYDRHGADFQSKSPDDYAAQAWHFLQRGKAGQIPMKWEDSEQTLRVYDPKTRAFAAYNRDGTTKTYFRPNSPTYWERQPGRPIPPEKLPFR